MFDPKGEEDFIVHSKTLLAGKTVILITHRPASRALADRVLHIENGEVKEQAAAAQ